MKEQHVRIARKWAETPDIAAFELVPTEGHSLPAFDAGAHIDVHTPSGHVRQYSLCNPPEETHRYRIAVLRDSASRGGSRSLHEQSQEGDTLTISPPRNHFPLVPEAQRHLLLAGGIGITPILAMARHLAGTPDTAFELHYCARSERQAAFVPVLREPALAGQVHLHFDDQPAQRLDLASLLSGHLAAQTHLYVCGPQGFIDAVLSAARSAHWPEPRLHREFFGAGASSPQAEGTFELVLARSGRRIPVRAEQSALQALLSAGIEVAHSCEQGVCGTCLTAVIDGEPDHRDLYLSPQEQAANDQFLPCCSRAKSPSLVLDL